MTALSRLALVGLLRAPGRTVIRVLTLAAAVALLGAMILFVGHSLRTMTGSAVRGVPIDWQAPVGSYAAAQRAAAGVSRQPGVLDAAAVATAPFAGMTHVAPAGSIRAGTGAILAVPPDYLNHLHTFRYLRGSQQPGEVVLDQQLAATLQAQPGDKVLLIPRAGAKPVSFVVSGIAIVNAPDVLFQPLNPLSGPAPAQPPANIAILPLETFAKTVAPLLPEAGSASPANNAVPGAQTGVQWQVQVKVDPTALTGSPAAALKKAGQIRGAVERSLPGQVHFVDNLSDTLTSATGDALYAETLYIMLAVPGAIVALGLAYLAALGTIERDRRELALLRARGASRRDLLTLAGVESVAVGLVAGVIGSAAALEAVQLANAGGGIGLGRVLVALGICIALAIAGAAAARIGSSLSAFRSSISASRRSVRRTGPPLWQRLYLDVICLVISDLVYWLTARTGFSAVVNPDSNPTLSLSVYMFLAPALLWIGAALVLLRLRGGALTWLARLGGGKRAVAPRAFLLASAGRRGEALNRGLLLVGLLLAFGVSLSVFTATYNQQSRVDAELTLGADAVVTAPPGAIQQRELIAAVSHVHGVATVSPIDHSYAYVGPDLQDIFGVDPGTIAGATTLRNSYFIGGSAKQILDRLRSTPGGVIVSKETITDYSLGVGDLLKLRVLDRSTGKFHIVPFHVVGIVVEFPSAPRDSFMVTNLSYLTAQTHDGGPDMLLAKTNGDPSIVAQRIAAATKSAGTSVGNIRQQTAKVVSSITAVDLGGISKIEEIFALILAAAAMGLFIAVAVAERRQEFATMAALGASLREIAAFLWTEAVLVLAASLAFAALLGLLIAELLVAMLQHVFDPPPDHLAMPWAYLGGLTGAAVAGTLLAAALAMRTIRRLPLGAILREE